MVVAQFFLDATTDTNLDEMEAEILRNKLYKVSFSESTVLIEPPSSIQRQKDFYCFRKSTKVANAKVTKRLIKEDVANAC